MKRLLVLIAFLSLSILSTLSTSFGQDFPYIKVTPAEKSKNLDIGSAIKTNIIKDNQSIIAKLLTAIGFPLPINYSDEPATAYISDLVNFFLGLVSFIALCVLLYGFYMIFFWEWEAGVAKAKKIVRGSAIAIAILFLSRFIISYLFFIYNSNTSLAIPPGGAFPSNPGPGAWGVQ